MKDLLFVSLFLVFLVLTFRNPFIGLCTWIWTVMSIPNNMLWGFASDLRFTYIVAIVTLLSIFINNDPFKRKMSHGIFFLMIILLIQSAISNVFTIGNSANAWTIWSDFFKAIFLVGLILLLLTTKNRIETFLNVLLVGVGFNIFFESLKFMVSMGAYEIVGIANSMMTDNNLFALATLMVVPLYLYAASNTKNKFLKIGFLGLTGLSLVCVIGSFSRGAFVGILIMGGQLFTKINLNRKILLICVAITISFITSQYASEKWVDRMQTIDNADEDLSFLSRVTAWKLATVAAFDRPLVGVGQDGMQYFHVWDYYYPDIGMLDFIDTTNVSRDSAIAAHSIYFQILGDTGFIGLILFITILIKAVNLSRKLSKNGNEEWIRELSKAINTVLIMFMIVGALLSMAYYDLLYALIAVLICIERINNESLNSKHAQNRNPPNLAK